MSARLLITGGGGMVGRNLIEKADSNRWTISAPLRAELDLTDAAAVARFIDDFRPDLIVHSAGKVGGIQANIDDPVEFLVANVDIGRNVIMSAWKAGVPRVINLASSCMYPRDGFNPLQESAVLTGELEPTNEGYALAKIFAMRLCEYIGRTDSRFAYRTLIPCNLYGRYDHFHSTRSHLVPAAIRKVHQAMIEQSESVELWGDGTARREFMYAGDLADAVFRAADDYDALPSVMNIGLGTDYSVLEYYQAAADVIGWTGTFTFDLTKPSGMKKKQVDISRQTAWGWSPPTTLRQGIAATYEYFLQEAQ